MNWDLRDAATRPLIVNGAFAEGDGIIAVRPGDTITGKTGIKWTVRAILLLVYGGLRLDVVSDTARRFACYPIDLEEAPR